MSHFYTDKLPVLLPTMTKGPVVGVRVKYVAEHGGLVVMPTDVPILKPGIPLVEIKAECPILVPLPTPGHYQDVRLTGHRIGLTWWLSAHTLDPDHVLVAWDGKSYLDDGGLSIATQLS